MDSGSIVKDPDLAPGGHRKIDWAARHSLVLNAVREKYLKDGSFEGLGVGVALPIEAKTAYLTVVLAEVGADVAVASPGPFFVQDDVAAALAERGVTVYASSDSPPEEADKEMERLSRAYTARGVPFDEGGALTRARRIGRLLIPIVIGGFRRADLLTTAMDTRCYQGGRGRTKLRQLRATPADWLILLLIVVWVLAAWQLPDRLI